MVTHGVSAGDVVAIMLPNTAELRGGAVRGLAPGRRRHADQPVAVPAEAAYQVADADAKVLIVDRPPEFDAPVVTLSTDDLAAGQPRPSPNPPTHRDDALALLIYTSGTTGRPKGVMLDHANLNAMCRMVIDAFELTSDDHSLLILPLFHVNGIVVGTLSPLLAGGRATVAGRFSPKTFFDRRRTQPARPTSPPCRPSTRCSPTCPPTCSPDTSSVRFAICGAAPASVELLEQVRNPLRHPDHRGLRAVGGLLRQHGQPAGRQAQARNRGAAAAGADDPDRRRRRQRRCPTARPARS